MSAVLQYSIYIPVNDDVIDDIWYIPCCQTTAITAAAASTDDDDAVCR